MNEAMKSSGLMLSCFLLWMSLQPDSRNHVSAVNLRRFIGCAVREFTFLARKPGCGSLHITTDACWGRCETWEEFWTDAQLLPALDVSAARFP
ncbi:glycoprotein hormone beta-5-like [Melanotaenia boesemani]|uniref:glycoprotein hormone beta-5-like n=1 Tax=Melanotaenia boesemani TaxID=1250792 RepID=UPI001C03C57E|nr:glycoprotein hormone beta-5-like [Melanotaenia boesemani]